ncbi:MAG: DUF438 domain-containing protein [Sphaerochaetaceae bacterium]|nr:DUF438 domain-containing protein [Sphaerochaetaceae bacterium]
MSAEIQNSDTRSSLLKDMIKKLHSGEEFEAVKKEFAEAFEGVGADEIADAEKKLIEEGEVSVEEVQRLCDVHSALVHGSVADIHGAKKMDETLGHPAWILKKENEHISHLLETLEADITALSRGDISALKRLSDGLTDLKKLDSHYAKKENLWFPLMENHGITAPPQVMWGVDDEIRGMVKSLRATFDGLMDSGRPDETTRETFVSDFAAAKDKISEMIIKENDILIPMVSEIFTPHEWKTIADGIDEFADSYVESEHTWEPEKESEEVQAKLSEGLITLPSGHFTPEELTLVLNILPVDITFVDKNDRVAYFSQSSERIFPRTLAIIGREVANCHPPASVHIVERIVNDFKSGARDVAEFYLHLGEVYVHIRYFAIRNEKKEYMGTVEVAQNIAPIQAISGDKKLLDW